MRRLEAGLRTLSLWDVAGAERANRALARRGIRRAFRVVSRLGDGVFWYVLMAAFVVAEGTAALVPVAHMAVVGAVGLAVYKWLKARTSRPRPYQVHAAIEPGADPLDAFSFPSGHTLHAIAFAILITAYYPGLAWVVLPFAGLVAASRLVLGLHYPSDVLAGAGIGAALALGSLAFV